MMPVMAYNLNGQMQAQAQAQQQAQQAQAQQAQTQAPPARVPPAQQTQGSIIGDSRPATANSAYTPGTATDNDPYTDMTVCKTCRVYASTVRPHMTTSNLLTCGTCQSEWCVCKLCWARFWRSNHARHCQSVHHIKIHAAAAEAALVDAARATKALCRSAEAGINGDDNGDGNSNGDDMTKYRAHHSPCH